jgi:hypothetical protein
MIETHGNFVIIMTQVSDFQEIVDLMAVSHGNGTVVIEEDNLMLNIQFLLTLTLYLRNQHAKSTLERIPVISGFLGGLVRPVVLVKHLFALMVATGILLKNLEVDILGIQRVGLIPVMVLLGSAYPKDVDIKLFSRIFK